MARKPRKQMRSRERINKHQEVTEAPAKSKVRPGRRKANARPNSATGSSQPIFWLQERQRPCRINQDISGTLSYHLIRLPQLRQTEREPRFDFVERFFEVMRLGLEEVDSREDEEDFRLICSSLSC